MSVRLQTTLDFAGAIYIDNRLKMNRYTVLVNLYPNIADADAINIAMDRLKMFVYSELADAVFIHQSDNEKAEVLNILGLNIVTLPEEPVDQIIGLMLYCKLNAVMEGVMVIDALDIRSYLGDDITYQFEEGDPLGPLAEDGWWHEPDTTHNNVPQEPAGENVVKVPVNGWVKYGLLWTADADAKPKDASTVVFGKFTKDADK